MTTTITYTGRLTTLSCWCGIVFAAPEELVSHARSDKDYTVHCPLGHGNVWREDDADRLRKEKAALEARLASKEGTIIHLRDQRDAADRSRAAMKGQATKLRKRAAGGACPCCKRSYVDVARHMATKHPGYAEAT